MVTDEKYHYLACLDKWLTIDEFFKMEDDHPVLCNCHCFKKSLQVLAISARICKDF